ncbi:hypothetical protein [Streptomyces sp. cmx-4-9]|uniref:hypothetical protein n=1 Tax=Streptomyces sp. cmx-4-9 TaxID=2790941 RepID=UPI003980A046
MKNRTKLIKLLVALVAAVAVGTTLPVGPSTTSSKVSTTHQVRADAGWQNPAPPVDPFAVGDAGWQ